MDGRGKLLARLLPNFLLGLWWDLDAQKKELMFFERTSLDLSSTTTFSTLETLQLSLLTLGSSKWACSSEGRENNSKSLLQCGPSLKWALPSLGQPSISFGPLPRYLWKGLGFLSQLGLILFLCRPPFPLKHSPAEQAHLNLK